MSEAVADYYCAARGIPESNKCPILWRRTGETITPDEFLTDIATPLRTFLSQRAGCTNGEAPDLASDPTKCIVLCYGIPLKIEGGERGSSVDSALTLLFNQNDWGRESIGCCIGHSDGQGGYVVNPYYYDGNCNPANRTIPTDFGEFRQSTYNHSDQVAPPFTVVRMLDNTHALAGGQRGILYRGILSNGTWAWTVIPDASKYFVASTINDISVLDSGHALACSNRGTVISTTDDGQTWFQVRNGSPEFDGYCLAKSVCLYDSSNAWILISKEWPYTTSKPTEWYIQKTYISNSQWHLGSLISTLPSNFTPASISVTDDGHIWLSGSSGIWFSSNQGATWTQQYSGNTGDIWVKNNEGWAVSLAGYILHWDGTSWSNSGQPTFSGSNPNVLIFYGATSSIN